jgi:hypothetical protein
VITPTTACRRFARRYRAATKNSNRIESSLLSAYSAVPEASWKQPERDARPVTLRSTKKMPGTKNVVIEIEVYPSQTNPPALWSGRGLFDR